MQGKHDFKKRYDVIVVGARCAGASVALLLARAGADVLVVDRQAYGSDTVSTHALMRAGVLQLRRWGLLSRLMALDTPPIEKSTFHYGDTSVPIDIKPDHDVAHLCAPRRDVLDRLLVDAAREAGATVCHGVSVSGLLESDDARVRGVSLKDAAAQSWEISADLVIGADGRQSTVSRLVDAPVYVQGRHSSGYVYGYFDGIADNGLHWYFEDQAAAGVIPTNGDQHCVFVGVPCDCFAETFRGNLEGGFLAVAGANSRDLPGELARVRRIGRLRGFSGGAGYLRHAYGPGWALVGDAGYFKDPLTAHGITDALRDAEILSRAVLAGSLPAFARYQEERDTFGRPFLQLTDAIASFSWDFERIKEHHARLSDLMKAESRRIADFGTPSNLAA